MASSDARNWPSIHSSEYAAAESMLQSARGFPLSDNHGYVGGAQTQAPMNQMQSMAIPPYTQPFRPRFQPTTVPEHLPTCNASLDGRLPSPPGAFDQHGQHSFQRSSPSRRSSVPSQTYPTGLENIESHQVRKSDSIDRSGPTSPASAGAFHGTASEGAVPWSHRSSNEDRLEVKEEMGQKPAWADTKTKAGKERKRLPLACIACRRKKIRCSGEKPACRHCTRSRIPCVYKVTMRKAAPRTDYMAMLDKRLKRMEERVIKVIPKGETEEKAVVPRAIVKPSASASVQGGKKRGAEEAFGPQIDEWAHSNSNTGAPKGQTSDDNRVNVEGAECLPSLEIQEHLSEVFFECLYGQSYHLMHKPSHMKRLRAGTLPPVLILAVCAISARFSTHPEVNTEPAFLRGEQWASPARSIALSRYDEPNITVLTVLLLLGLHEFGTCQGGRSWMFAGMATRMAYALQLHRELDHDPLGLKTDRKSELSFTDREIRRRTMWACFLMDRFNSSGTERPMFADEETIKVQLPIKEAHFEMEIPGATESLHGAVPNSILNEAGQLSNPKDNMGVAAYMIRIITLWGRVIKYLNMGGKEKDEKPLWDQGSGFADLKRQANDFKRTLPAELRNSQENLHNHDAAKLANQFLFMHIASNQVMLFLHRFAIPSAPGARSPIEAPKSFLAEAGPIAIDAASQISALLKNALEHNAVAPFIGYCAFLSSTVHVWGIFSKNSSLEESSKTNLATNVKYLSKMKKHWGIFRYVADNLKDIYRQHADAVQEGGGESAKQDATLFQYGDWFTKYPHGVSHSEYEDSAATIKKESTEEAALSQKSDLQSVEDLLSTLSSPIKTAHSRKNSKRIAKIAAQPAVHPHQLPQPEIPDNPLQDGFQSISIPSVHQSITPLASSTFHCSNPTTQLYAQPGMNSFPGPHDLLPLQAPTNTALLPQLDRRLVSGAYAGNDPTASSSASALYALASNTQGYDQGQDPGSATSMWDGSINLQQQQQQQMQNLGGVAPFMDDVQTSAWFMPFNINPTELIGDEEYTRGFGGFGENR